MKRILANLILVASLNAFAAEPPLFFDSGVNGLMLEDKKSGQSFLSDQFPDQDLTGFSFWFSNDDDSETLAVFIHPEDTVFNAAEILVRASLPKESFPKFLGLKGAFETEKGIKLGITAEDVIKILGKPTAIKGDAYLYRVEDSKYLLDTYNLPIYYGEYTFNEGRLIGFKFGFEYP
ncbi:MAG TPA: hypothetical protein VFX02_02930 [Gammaproteobacteria bacterium]|nr:hypothetical protein [Gammaproteobacteria bacterium]